MATDYVLYNPIAGGNNGAVSAGELRTLYPDRDFRYTDITTVRDYAEYFEDVPPDDRVIVCGGDGTLNRFINDTRGLDIENELFYYATGSGNDFLCDLGMKRKDKPVRINEYISALPTVTVNGSESRFLNGIGYGIDGYCCEVGDKIRETSDKSANYTAIAVKGLLFHYVPCGAVVTVDGETRRYEKVWLAPTMNGRFYGGGMMPTPNQDRLDPEHKLSLMVFHDTGKLRTLTIFPSIFKGEHVKHTEAVDIISGREISVSFDKPTALQIDGETVLNVTQYTARAAATA